MNVGVAMIRRGVSQNKLLLKITLGEYSIMQPVRTVNRQHTPVPRQKAPAVGDVGGIITKSTQIQFGNGCAALLDLSMLV